MEALDIELALRIYRQLGDAAMVLGLEKVLQVRNSDGTLPDIIDSNVVPWIYLNIIPSSILALHSKSCFGRLRTRS